MAQPAIIVSEKTHEIMKKFKDKEGVSFIKQIEFLIKESPRYQCYIKKEC